MKKIKSKEIQLLNDTAYSRVKKKVQYRTIQKKNLKLHDIKEGWQRVRLRFIDFFLKR